MKNLKLNLKNLALIAVVVSALFAVSCNKDDDFLPQESVSMEEVDLKAGKAVSPGEYSIVDIALGNPAFDTLVAALLYVDAELDAGLVNLLSGTDQYTVFAPTDAAFGRLYAALGVDDITEVPAETVLAVLQYHVTEGRRAANSVVPKVNTRTIETALGVPFSVDQWLKIWAVGNTANIIAANISASNGIIHVIDEVILPIEL